MPKRIGLIIGMAMAVWLMQAKPAHAIAQCAIPSEYLRQCCPWPCWDPDIAHHITEISEYAAEVNEYYQKVQKNLTMNGILDSLGLEGLIDSPDEFTQKLLRMVGWPADPADKKIAATAEDISGSYQFLRNKITENNFAKTKKRSDEIAIQYQRNDVIMNAHLNAWAQSEITLRRTIPLAIELLEQISGQSIVDQEAMAKLSAQQAELDERQTNVERLDNGMEDSRARHMTNEAKWQEEWDQNQQASQSSTSSESAAAAQRDAERLKQERAELDNRDAELTTIEQNMEEEKESLAADKAALAQKKAEENAAIRKAVQQRNRLLLINAGLMVRAQMMLDHIQEMQATRYMKTWPLQAPENTPEQTSQRTVPGFENVQMARIDQAATEMSPQEKVANMNMLEFRGWVRNLENQKNSFFQQSYDLQKMHGDTVFLRRADSLIKKYRDQIACHVNARKNRDTISHQVVEMTRFIKPGVKPAGDDMSDEDLTRRGPYEDPEKAFPAIVKELLRLDPTFYVDNRIKRQSARNAACAVASEMAWTPETFSPDPACEVDYITKEQFEEQFSNRDEGRVALCLTTPARQVLAPAASEDGPLYATENCGVDDGLLANWLESQKYEQYMAALRYGWDIQSSQRTSARAQIEELRQNSGEDADINETIMLQQIMQGLGATDPDQELAVRIPRGNGTEDALSSTLIQIEDMGDKYKLDLSKPSGREKLDQQKQFITQQLIDAAQKKQADLDVFINDPRLEQLDPALRDALYIVKSDYQKFVRFGENLLNPEYQECFIRVGRDVTPNDCKTYDKNAIPLCRAGKVLADQLQNPFSGLTDQQLADRLDLIKRDPGLFFILSETDRAWILLNHADFWQTLPDEVQIRMILSTSDYIVDLSPDQQKQLVDKFPILIKYVSES